MGFGSSSDFDSISGYDDDNGSKLGSRSGSGRDLSSGLGTESDFRNNRGDKDNGTFSGPSTALDSSGGSGSDSKDPFLSSLSGNA